MLFKETGNKENENENMCMCVSLCAYVAHIMCVCVITDIYLMFMAYYATYLKK